MNDRKEPVTDLRLSLGYSNQGTQLIENSGPGANATSRLDMAFVASDHLTELVWSPRKGLSIRCTNCSTAAEESRHMLALGMGSKATSADQVSEPKAASVNSPGKNVRILGACQSAYRPVNEGLRCYSSSFPKDLSKLHGTPVQSMLNVSSRKRGFHTSNQNKDLCLPEKAEQPQGLEPTFNNENQQSNFFIPEENQKHAVFKKGELGADDDFLAVASNTTNSGYSVNAGVKLCHNNVNRVRDNVYPDKNSPTESKINEYRRKGKAKVLSDGNAGYGEEECRGRVESCSSVGPFRSQKKRTSEQELNNETESKRMKTTIQRNPHPTSLVNGGSSFLSWISNMTKGIIKANHNGSPSLALTLTPAGPQKENSEWELFSHRSNEKYPCQKMGFQNILQSIYCTNSKENKQSAFTGNHAKIRETLDACIGSNNMTDVTPLSVYDMTSSNCKGDQPSGNEERLLVLSRNGDNREYISPEIGASCNFLTKVQTIKIGSSKSSPDIRRSQNIGFSPHSGNKEGLSDVMDPLQSFWVTRFCPKSPIPESIADNRGQILCIDNQTKHPEKNILRYSQVSKVVQLKGSLNEELLVAGQEDEASDSDACTGLKEDLIINAQMSECKKKSTERLKSSEPMASMFARRLDAIKHMTPSVMIGNATKASTTCFYCGKKGHNLRNCSEIAENELKGHLDRIGSQGSISKTLCLCIMCFQIGHWANDCPSARPKISACGPMVISNADVLDRSNSQVLDHNKDIPRDDVPSTDRNQDYPEPNPEFRKKYAKPDPINHELEESAKPPLPNLKDGRSSDTLKEYFDAVRMIRLSRKEILKMVNSPMLLSNLEGFFLRLRLGKMENGLGGTGYHVAHIEGIQSEVSFHGSELILPVNIGKNKCLVGSGSISNQDFLEEELMTWWSVNVKNGDKFPTQEKLNEKLQQRNKLGI